MIPNQYYYITGTLILGIIWFIVYIARKDLRSQIIKVSTFLTIFGLTEHFWYYGRYWTPTWLIKLPFLNAGIEDFLLCFFYGGIAAALYEEVFRKRLIKNRKYSQSQRQKILIVAILTGFLTVLLGENVFKLGIIFSTGWGIVTTGLVLLYYRKDLLKPALLNFLLMLVVVLLWQGGTRLLFPNMYSDFWIRSSVSNVYWFGVLFEEYFFHACMAFGIGPIFEVFYGYSDR